MNTAVEMNYTEEDITDAVMSKIGAIILAAIADLTSTGESQSDLDVVRALAKAAEELVEQEETELIFVLGD